MLRKAQQLRGSSNLFAAAAAAAYFFLLSHQRPNLFPAAEFALWRLTLIGSHHFCERRWLLLLLSDWLLCLCIEVRVS